MNTRSCITFCLALPLLGCNFVPDSYKEQECNDPNASFANLVSPNRMIDLAGRTRMGTLGALEPVTIEEATDVLTVPTFEGQAALDGYYAQYEVDMGPVPSCEVTIPVANSVWPVMADLYQDFNVVCLEVGDHSHKETLEMPNTQGTFCQRKWLMAEPTAATMGKNPFSLPQNQRAIITHLRLQEEDADSNVSNASAYVTLYQLSIESNAGSLLRVRDCEECIVNNCHIDGLDGVPDKGHDLVVITGASPTYFQNNVVHNTGTTPPRRELNEEGDVAIPSNSEDPEGLQAAANAAYEQYLDDNNESIVRPDHADAFYINSNGAEKRTYGGGDETCLVVAGTRQFVVNNQIFDCGGDGVVMDTNSAPDGTILENNDIYQTEAYWTDCAGVRGAMAANGDQCSCGEDGVDVKDGGDVGLPVILTRNRIHGWLPGDSFCSSTGSAGQGINTGGPELADGYIMMLNNIVGHSSYGITTNKKGRVSVVGNLLYEIDRLGISSADAVNNANDVIVQHKEIYLNTMILKPDSNARAVHHNLLDEYIDVRCNHTVGGDFFHPSFAEADFAPTTTWDNNSICDVTGGTKTTPSPLPDGEEIEIQPAPWSANSAYQAGDVVYASTDNGFVYRLMVAGDHFTEPVWPTGCGETVSADGSTWEAVLCPFSYTRRAHDAQGSITETVSIDYALPSVNAHHFNKCAALGTTPNLGVDDAAYAFGDNESVSTNE